ncbi:hypothetical protein [Streptomyces phaeochromogenes]
MAEEFTTHETAYLQWGKDGGLTSVATFPTGTPCDRIADYRQRVAAKGGVTIEAYTPDPADVPIQSFVAAHRQLVAAIELGWSDAMPW